MDKEVRELAQKIEERERSDGRKFEVRQEGRHLKVFLGDQAILDPQGGHPVTLPTTPSDPTWYENTVKMLVRSRILADDPKKEGQRGVTPEQAQAREEESEAREGSKSRAEALRETARKNARERQENTTVLRDRYERLFAPIGVWKPGHRGTGGGRASYTEIGQVAFHWAEGKGIEPRPPSEQAAKTLMRHLYDGDSLMDPNRRFLRAFADHLERSDNPTRTYNNLLRKLLGIGETRAAVPPETKEEVEPESEEQVAHAPQPQRDGDEPAREPGPARAAVNGELAELRVRLAEEIQHAAAARAENAQLRDELDAAKAPRFANGDVPTLALETLAEMIGQHITVGPDDAASYADIQAVVAERRTRGVEVAKRILEMELRAS